VRLLYSPVIPDKTHAVWTQRNRYRHDSMKRTKDVRNKSAMVRRRLFCRRFKHHTTMKEGTLFLPMHWMCMGGMKVQRQSFLTLARDGGEWSVPGNLRRQPMNKRLVGARTPILTPWRDDLPMPSIERLPEQPAHSLLTTPTELRQLHEKQNTVH
jgi:hypothetical protein